MSDYFDNTQERRENTNDNQKKQSRAFVKEAFCEENLKLDVNQVQLIQQKHERSTDGKRPI